MLTFRPLSEAELRALGAGETLTVHYAFAATHEFLDAFGLDAPDDEDAERTLLYLAGLAALQRHGRRLVAVADLHASGHGNPLGVVSAEGVDMAHVSALFADAPETEPLAHVVAQATAQLTMEQAWDHPSHEALLEKADLMWFGPEEWERLLGD